MATSVAVNDAATAVGSVRKSVPLLDPWRTTVPATVPDTLVTFTTMLVVVFVLVDTVRRYTAVVFTAVSVVAPEADSMSEYCA